MNFFMERTSPLITEHLGIPKGVGQKKNTASLSRTTRGLVWQNTVNCTTEIAYARYTKILT